jgi:orotate phosphoribosyltransferase
MNDRLALLDLLARIAFERRKVILRSGREADFYLDCRRVTLDPEGARLCGRVMVDVYRAALRPVAAVGGPTMGADPLVTAFQLRALELGERLPGFLVRKEAKAYGMASRIEGRFGVALGAEVLLVEDVLTTGGSLLLAAEAVREEGLVPVAAMVLVDRQEGGSEAMAAAGIPVVAAFTAAEVSARADRK